MAVKSVLLSMKTKLKVEVYKSKDGWRWRIRHNNGRILADSGEAYARRTRMMRMFSRMLGDLAGERFRIEYVIKK